MEQRRRRGAVEQQIWALGGRTGLRQCGTSTGRRELGSTPRDLGGEGDAGPCSVATQSGDGGMAKRVVQGTATSPPLDRKGSD